jgi:hypothetical protein
MPDGWKVVPMGDIFRDYTVLQTSVRKTDMPDQMNHSELKTYLSELLSGGCNDCSA